MEQAEENGKVTLEALGFGPFFEQGLRQQNLEGSEVARVIGEQKGAYRVKNQHGEFISKVTGRQMYKAESREDFPAVGDWVAVSRAQGDLMVIQGILPRKSLLKRPNQGKHQVQILAANLDEVLVAESVDRDFNLNRIERYFALAAEGGIKPAIILNKTDLLETSALQEKISLLKERFVGVPVILANTKTPEGPAGLEAYIKSGKTYSFLGSSGVGKSSLINELLGGNLIKTAGISLTAGRGKHTTTSRGMYFLKNGAMVIDNPGMREVGVAEAGEGVQNVFGDITALSAGCKYADCTHTHEPGCAVLEELSAGRLDREQYQNYLNLKKESEYYGLNKLQKKQKDRRFGKFLKSAKKDIKYAKGQDQY